MTIRTLLVALGVGWIAALAGLVWMASLVGMRPPHLTSLLTDMDIVLQAFATLSVVSAAAGIIGLRVGAQRRATLGFAGAFGWGALGALYGAASARIMLINMTPPIPVSVYALGYAEALLVLLVGLTGALLGLGLLRRRSSR